MRRFIIVLTLLVVLLTMTAVAFAQTGQVYHVVAFGDTLASIAQRYNVSASAIVSVNNIVNANYIFVGQRLLIPLGSGDQGGGAESGSTLYIVGPGDTLASIAQLFGVTAQSIASANGLYNNQVYVGQQLVIPYGTTPQPTPQPQPQPQPGNYVNYVVQPGDNLSRIARNYNTTMQAIATANGIFNYNFIYVGQVLRIPVIPVTTTYVVQRGDNLTAIAARFGTTVAKLQAANNITNPRYIFPGQTLVIAY